MEALLIILIALMIILIAGIGYLVWFQLKPKPIPSPEKAFEEFKKMNEDLKKLDPDSDNRLEQISKLIHYTGQEKQI